MARLLMAIGASEAGGAQRVFAELAREFSNRGWMVSVLLPPGPLADEMRGFPLASFDIVPFDGPRMTASVARVIRKIRPDFLQLHLARGCFWGGLANIPWGVPTCGILHNSPLHGALRPWRRLVYPALYRLLGRLADGLVVFSERGRRELVDQTGVPSERVTVVNLGVDMSRFASLRRGTGGGGTFRIGTIGRLAPEKGQMFLLEALAGLSDFDWSCSVIGDGPCAAELRNRTTELGLSERVRLVGYVVDPLPELTNLDLFVLPSVDDAFPLVVLEAFAVGTPVIATDVGGVSEMVREGETGVLIPPRDPSRLADAIRYAYAHPDAMERMAARARSRAEANFSMIAVVDSLIRCMDRLAGGRSLAAKVGNG